MLNYQSEKTRDQGVEYRYSETFVNESHIQMEDFWSKSVSHTTNQGI